MSSGHIINQVNKEGKKKRFRKHTGGYEGYIEHSTVISGIIKGQ